MKQWKLFITEVELLFILEKEKKVTKQRPASKSANIVRYIGMYIFMLCYVLHTEEGKNHSFV